MRDALFRAQSALLSGDTAEAASAIDAAAAAAAPLLAVSGESASAQSLTAALGAARDAVGRSDSTALAIARGQIWTALLGIAYHETVRAVGDGRQEDAGRWLLLRDFRPSTRFSRPGADATLSIRDLANGETTPDQALAAVQADLLDTYQAQLETALTDAGEALQTGLRESGAEEAGKASGYWAIVAPAFAEQQGVEARRRVDATFAALLDAIRAGDDGAFTAAQGAAVAAVQSFRAAPLSDDAQARRAGQLLLYLSLVPVEYGRGVKQGEVVVEIEIQEAQSFLDGARAAFNDLRLPLNQREPAVVADVSALLDRLDANVRAAGRREAVADPDAIKQDANDAASRLKAIFPKEWERAGGAADFDVVASILDQMEAALAAGQYRQAESARLEAYAIYDAGPEKRLLAFDPALTAKIERLFWQGDGDVQGLAEAVAGEASSGEVRETRRALDKALLDAQRTLGSAGTARGAVVFNAAVIVFREGLEAVLILTSLLASMIGSNQRYKRPLVIGALAALAASAALFVLARNLLLSLNRYGEKVEAIVSVVAIGVLLLVLNWFFHKVYWTRWIARHHNRRRLLIGGAAGQAVGLVALGFTSVFREGAETVLFLQALVLDAGTWVVIEGTLLGLAATAVVGALTFILQTKLPHKKMLTVTGIMIAAVLVTMVGNTVHVFQVVGWAPISPISGLELPYWLGLWFGVYATWEGIVFQAAAAIFVLGSYVVAEQVQQRSRRRLTASALAG